MRIVFISLMALLLSACGEEDELNRFMETAGMDAAAKLPPVVKPRIFVPAAYQNARQVDPFVYRRPDATLAQGKHAPDMNRQRSDAELYPLDSFRMIGYFHRAGVSYAMLRASDSHVYSVREGGWLGQDYGRVISVAPDHIEIVESVQDGSGDWMKRNSSIYMEIASSVTAGKKEDASH